jgi:hypothetical protein
VIYPIIGRKGYDKRRYHTLMAVASIIISTVSLLLSITVAIATLWYRGKLHMLRPMLIGFLSEAGQPKLFVRAMIYATGKRGRIVEALYLKVRRGDSTQAFNFWMYGETKPDIIGSGLMVGENGVALNHYFLPPKAAAFRFLAGEYLIEVHAKILNRSTPVVLAEVKLSLSEELATTFADPSMGVLFTWMADSQCYRGEVHAPPVVGRSHSVSGAGPGKLPWA